jgi:hypothetical protein
MTGGFSKEALSQYQALMSQQLGSNHDFTECVDIFDFRLCQRPSGTFYGTAGQCRLGVEVKRDDVINEIKSLRKVTPKQAKALSELSDEDLGRVHRAIKENASIDIESAQRVSSAVKSLAGETEAGGKKKGGDNLQDPVEAEKYAKFYEEGRDQTHRPPHNTSPEEVKAVLAELKDTLDNKEYRAVLSALGGKGSPTREQVEEAGWKNKAERGEAVLKSLIDNEFKDVNGNFLSWRQGLQLDHRLAGSQGGTDKPDNWIWISTATNQTKGSIEAQVKREVSNGTIPASQGAARINQILVTRLKENAAMSAEDVAKAKDAGSAKILETAQKVGALRDNLPLMTPEQRLSQIDSAKGSALKDLMKASTTTADGGGYRPVVSGGDGARTRSSYPSAGASKALMKARWGLPLSSSDLKAIASIVNESTGSSKSNKELLDILLGEKFKPATPLSKGQMDEILANITRQG